MSSKPITPMMEQYLELKREHQNEVLFFRLGDFYEMFLDDAKEVSQLLNLTLTSRNGVPMCGIPYHAAKNYIKRLLDEGKKIAVCEQVELPHDNRSIARREVVQTITPGTVVEDEFLEAGVNNYLLAISLHHQEISCAYCELSSGTFSLLSFSKEHRFESVRSLYEQLKPKEVIIHEDDYFTYKDFAQIINQMESMCTRLPAWYFSKSHAFELLKNHVGSLSLKQFGIDKEDTGLLAAGALFRYMQETAKTSLTHITELRKVDQSHYLLIDESTRKNLELVNNLQEGGTQRTLFSTLNMTCTSGGSRMLKDWISSPLARIDDILERQHHVTWYVQNEAERQRVRTLLSGIRDVSRLITRVSMNRANPQDLVAIRQSIAAFFELTQEHSDYYRSLLGNHVHDSAMTELVKLMEILIAGIREDCQGPFFAGRVIKSGYSQELDNLRELQHDGRKSLESYVSSLKQETDISTIKLSHNKIIGYFIEIPKTHNNKIPDWFYRKQTLVSAERYTTDELINLETQIIASGDQADELEKDLYEELLRHTAELQIPIMRLGEFFSTIDCMQSLAHTAQRNEYCKPEIIEDEILTIESGRHPVVEQYLPKGEFVHNSLLVGGDYDRFCLITGPNMAGKSTYLRQNALIVLMAHIGSYVPAASAKIGLTDRLFCRVGASDNLARGESTFLIEMQEAAFILRTATSRSLAIMDEIGRGTSTQDGMSIAYAVMRAMVELHVKTLFATHYHELTMLDTSGMQLLTLAVAESKRSIVFLRKIQQGVADSSYGLHVAKMAGIPAPVIREAAQFQKLHFADYELRSNSGQLDLFKGSTPPHETESPWDSLISEIRDFPIEESTPMETMRFLDYIQDEINNFS